MTDKEITDDDDFVMIERNGEILSGGFKVNSILLKNKRSPMHTLNKRMSGGEGNNVSDLFKDLAVPAGIFFQPSKFSGGNGEHKRQNIEEQEIEEDLYDKLVKLASVEDTQKGGKQKKTRRIKKDAENKKITKKLKKTKIT
jgi:hypothetical protein